MPLRPGRSRSLVATIVASLLFAVLAIGAPPPASAQAGGIDWIRQFGSAGFDFPTGVAVDASGVYVAGSTDGTFPGQTSAGGQDAWVRRYAPDGVEQWTRQFGTASNESSYPGVAADASGVYVVGETDGTFPGQTSPGGSDAFVRKYDPDGVEQWTRQFGTEMRDVALGVAADASGVYVVGFTYGIFPGQAGPGFPGDAFIRKYDADGVEQWTRQFGTDSEDAAYGVAVDAAGVYVAGITDGTFPGHDSAGGRDLFVRKYDADGAEHWTRQFGTADFEYAEIDVAADASGVYVVGGTAGTFPGQESAGGVDAFVHKYDADGVEQWTRQFGTAGPEWAYGVAADASGVYVAGVTYGILPGQSGSPGDAFIRQYDAAGVEQWTQQFGTPSPDEGAQAVAADASGIYVVGATSGTFPGQDIAGGFDAFVAKFTEEITDTDGDGVPDSDDLCAETPSGEIPDAGGCSPGDLVAALEAFRGTAEGNLRLAAGAGAFALVTAAQAEEGCGRICEWARALLFSINRVIGAWSAVDAAITAFTPQGSGEVLADSERLGRLVSGLEKAHSVIEVSGAVFNAQGLVKDLQQFRLFKSTLGELGDEVLEVLRDQGPGPAFAWAEYRLAFDSPAPIPQRSGVVPAGGVRPLDCSPDWAEGSGDVRRNVEGTFSDLLALLPEEVPADFPTSDLVLEARRLSSLLEAAGVSEQPVEVDFTIVPDGLTAVERSVTLGTAAQLKGTAQALFIAWEQDLEVQQADSVVQAGSSIYNVISLQVEGTTTPTVVTKAVTDLLVSAGTLAAEEVVLYEDTVDAAQALHGLGTGAAWDVAAEATGIWAIADGLASQVLLAMGEGTSICAFSTSP